MFNTKKLIKIKTNRINLVIETKFNQKYKGK